MRSWAIQQTRHGARRPERAGQGGFHYGTICAMLRIGVVRLNAEALRVRETALDESGRANHAGASEERACVLLVDDDALIRMVAAEDLRLAGFHVLEARDAAEALRLIDSGATVNMVVTDVEMPGPMDGLALAPHLRARFATLPIAVISGRLDVVEAGLDDIPFLSKPCSDEALVGLVTQKLKGTAT